MTPGGWQLLKLCCYLVEFDCQLFDIAYIFTKISWTFWAGQKMLLAMIVAYKSGWMMYNIGDEGCPSPADHLYSIVFLHSCTEWHLLKVHFALENAGKPLECRNEGRFKPCSICSGESNWRWQKMQLVKSGHQVFHELATSANMAIRLKTPLKTNVSIQHPIQQHLSRLWWVMGTLASILPETDSLHWKMDGFCIYWVLSFWGPVSQPICLSFLGPGFSLGPSSPSHKASGFPSELDTPYLADGKTRRFSYRFLSVTQLGANPYGIRAAGISYLHMVDVLM